MSKTIEYYPLDLSVTLSSLPYDISLAMLMKEDPFVAVAKRHSKYTKP